MKMINIEYEKIKKNPLSYFDKYPFTVTQIIMQQIAHEKSKNAYEEHLKKLMVEYEED